MAFDVTDAPEISGWRWRWMMARRNASRQGSCWNVNQFPENGNWWDGGFAPVPVLDDDWDANN